MRPLRRGVRQARAGDVDVAVVDGLGVVPHIRGHDVRDAGGEVEPLAEVRAAVEEIDGAVIHLKKRIARLDLLERFAVRLVDDAEVVGVDRAEADARGRAHVAADVVERAGLAGGRDKLQRAAQRGHAWVDRLQCMAPIAADWPPALKPPPNVSQVSSASA